MTKPEIQVLLALVSRERTSSSARIAIRRIARAALEGDDDLAAAVLAQLDLKGYLRTDTMGWYSGWLTSKARAVPSTGDAA